MVVVPEVDTVSDLGPDLVLGLVPDGVPAPVTDVLHTGDDHLVCHLRDMECGWVVYELLASMTT